ncbi:MAG: glycosyltransferase family 39 protein [Candidatus Omnitrophica bacterium]|nr:glycosyltransferase family 39 protein [Candidatus Omnitrophota bacterium]
MKKISVLAIMVFVIGVALRVQLLHAPYIEDERKNIYIAQQISFAPGHAYLPLEHKEITHPLLNVYLTKLGMSVWGETGPGPRVIHFMLGSLTLALVYLLARTWGEMAGVWALAALAFNPYHLHATVRTENASSLLFFTALALWLFYRAMETRRGKWMIALGPVMGAAFLTKGVSLLLVPAMGLLLIGTADQRFWWRSRSLYIAAGLFMLTISPWLIWVSVHGTHQLMFEPGMYKPGMVRLNPTAVHFYLIDLFCRLSQVEPRMVTSWEYGRMDIVSGLVLLLGVVWTTLNKPDRLARWLLACFAVIVVVLSFFRREGNAVGEFWWVNLSLIPAVCLAGRMLSSWNSRGKIFRLMTCGVFIFLCVHAACFVRALPADILYPPRRFCPLVDQDYTVARLAMTDGRYDLARQEFKRHLRYAPNNVEILSFLGLVDFHQGRFDAAVDYWARALVLEPHYVHVSNKLINHSAVLRAHFLRRWHENTADPRAAYYLGVVNFYDGQFDQARAFFDRLSRQKPGLPASAYYKARLHYAKKEYAVAETMLREVLRKRPGFTGAYFALGQACLKEGRYREAVAAFDGALRFHPQDLKSMYYRAQAFEKLGAAGEASVAYRAALDLVHADLIQRLRETDPPPYSKILSLTRGAF